MQGLATGRLEAGPELQRHLDQCLGCRACERACPAGVPYGELIDAGRTMLRERGARPDVVGTALSSLVRRPRWLRLATRLARWPGARALLRLIGGLPARAAELLPADGTAFRAPPPYPGPGGHDGAEVLLFNGCIGGAIDGRTLADITRLLGAAGWRVRSPGRQGCCGALDLHAGRPELARKLAQKNLAAFAGDAPVAVCASGCAATLQEYARLAGAPGEAFGARIKDPLQLLAESRLSFGPSPYAKVALHVPCTQRNVTGSAPAARALLGRIPGLCWTELPAGCCGAAGEMFLVQPELADALLAPLLERLVLDPPDALLSSNIGCALHFRAGLARVGLDIPVLHPASLAAAALK